MWSPRVAFRFVPPAGAPAHDIAVADGWLSYDCRRGRYLTASPVPDNGTFELGWTDALRPPLRVDAAVHLQLWRRMRAPGAPFHVQEPAGCASFLLCDLADGAWHRAGVRVVAFTAYGADAGSVARGEVEARLLGPAPDSWAEPTQVDYVPANAGAVQTLLDAEVRLANAFGDPAEQDAAGARVEFTTAIMERVRMRYYATGPARLPGFLLFRNLNRHVAPDAGVLEAHLVAAAQRYGWSTDGLVCALGEALRAPRLADRHVLALDALAAALTLACVSMTYVADYAPDANGSNRPVEYYGDALRWKAGDCEDFAALSSWLALAVQRMDPPEDCLLLRAAHRVLARYVVLGCAMTVQGAQLSDAAPLASDAGAGAHMQCTLWPTGHWLASLRRMHPGAGLPPGVPESVGPDLPPLQLEGTGDMFAVQTPARWIDEGSAAVLAAWMDEVDLAYDLLFHPSRYGAGPDPRMQYWRQRRLPHRGCAREGLTNDFYRQYRVVVASGYGLPAWELRGAPTNACQFDVGTTRRIDGTTATFSIGAPAYDVDTAADTTVLATAPASTAEGRAAIGRAAQHIQPATAFVRGGDLPDAVVAQAARMREALGPACRAAPLEFSTGAPVLVTLFMRHSHVAHTDWRADLTAIGHAPFVAVSALYPENVLSGLYNYVLQLYVTVPRK